MSSLSKTTTIVKNSGLLYIRMFFVMFINLYSVRLIIAGLGLSDYGIFNVVAGTITMLQSVSVVLSLATQRFYSIAMGKSNLEELRKVYSVSIIVHSLFALFVFLFSETVGLWFVETQLNIPSSRISSAIWLFQFSMISFIFSFLAIPFSALVIANEDMGFFAVISVIDSLFKLLYAFIINQVNIDRLVLYPALLAFSTIVVFSAYFIFTRKKYNSCRFLVFKDKKLYRDFFSFSIWNMFGSCAGVAMNQGITILINIFFGPIITAARAVSLQVSSALSSFSSSFVTAIQPPMIKSYAEHNYSYLNKIFSLSNKFIYYSLLIICIPLCFDMPFLLELWLGEFDQNTVLFSRLIVIYTLILSLNNPISITIHATGRIKEYSIPVECINLLCVPIVYVLYRLNYGAFTAYLSMIVCVILSHIMRLIILKKYYADFSISKYFLQFVFPAVFITILVLTTVFVFRLLEMSAFLKLLLTILVSIVSVISFVYLFGLEKNEKSILIKYVKNIF